jgi:tetratricopeptide (TPR) repeat protein
MRVTPESHPWAERLRAERRRRLWAPKDMVRELMQAAADQQVSIATQESLLRMLRDWESGRNKPRDPYPQLYAAAFGIEEADLFADDVSPALPAIDQAVLLHRGLQLTLAAGTMTDASLDEWEYTVHRYGRATRYRPEGQLLPELVADFADLQRILAHPHPARARKRLTRVAANLAGLMALTLLKLGDPSARGWWRTGRAAAAMAEDIETLSWMYAQEAYQLYYSEDMYGAIELAFRAQQLAGTNPYVGAALAAPLEARAHAVMGNREMASAALLRAELALGRLDPTNRVGSAFGYSEQQLAFHSGNAWTHLGDTARAGDEQTRALELYTLDERTDRALIHLDRAMCLAINGDSAASAMQAVETIVDLPPEYRSALILHRAKEVGARVPKDMLEARALQETLMLPPGGKDE